MIEKILRAHFIETKRIGDELFALDCTVDKDGKLCNSWINVTHWSAQRVYHWLGY